MTTGVNHRTRLTALPLGIFAPQANLFPLSAVHPLQPSSHPAIQPSSHLFPDPPCPKSLTSPRSVKAGPEPTLTHPQTHGVHTVGMAGWCVERWRSGGVERSRSSSYPDHPCAYKVAAATGHTQHAQFAGTLVPICNTMFLRVYHCVNLEIES